MVKSDSQKQFNHLDTITAFFVAVLLISNVVSSKITSFGIFTFDVGTILFPLSYIFGDILTEVYGYQRSRKVIWIGFFCNILMAVVFMAASALPSATDWHNQDAYEKILGLTPRIVAASMIAYFAGEFTNSFILAKLKVITKGKWLWSRTIGSTIAGELVDTAFFVLIAFWGIFDQGLIISIIISNYIFKTGVEILFTPITYKVVNWLKKVESEDYFDKDTDFNPFLIQK